MHSAFTKGTDVKTHFKIRRTFFSAAKKYALTISLIALFASVTAAQTNTFPSSGNAGIGTTTPSYPLTISQTGNSINRLVSLANDSSGASAQTAFSFFEGATEKFKFGLNSSGATGYVGGVNAFQLWHFQNAPIIFGTNSIERVRIDGGGNVGIGTTTPGYKLEVAGTIRSSTGGFMFPNGSVQTTAATMTGVTAGSGLTGGGTSGNATVDIGAGTGVTVTADAISVNYGSTAGTAVEGNKSVTVTAGNGMSGGGSITLGSGGTVTLDNNDRGSSQNIFKNVANAAGTTQFSAGTNTDAIRFEGTGGSSVSFNVTEKKVTIDSSGITSSQWTTSGSNINYATAGNVGIGQSNPTYKLDVNGTAHVSGNMTVDGNIAAKYQDLAEWVPSSEQLSAGTVVVLDTTQPNQVISSIASYDTRVAGVISAQPGITLGESGEGKVLVATTGRVRVKVDATRGPIQIGDLLVTSNVSGVAMKSDPVNLGGVQIHRPGTIIGKALEPLAKGKGEILVLLSLQ